MRIDAYLQLGHLCIIALSAMVSAASSPAICYSTPTSAVTALELRSASSINIKSDGYAVIRVELDPVLGKKWAVVSHCGYPNLPLTAVPTNAASSFSVAQRIKDSKAPLVVRAGDPVRLWKQESGLRLELSGIAEESGGLGANIRVRLAHKNADDQSAPQQFLGAIRGQAEVEISR